MKIPEIIKKNKTSIILLALFKESNGQKQMSIRGTGFICSREGHFVTNAHVYKQIPEGEKENLVAMVHKEVDDKGIDQFENLKISLVKIDDENDLALFKLESKGQGGYQPINGVRNFDNTQEGDDVVIVGFPLATELVAMGFGITMNSIKATISSVKRRGRDGSLHFFMVDTHINSGSSGSPVFAVSDGKVIGVAQGRIGSAIVTNGQRIGEAPANLGICVPSNYINNLLKNII